MNNNQSSQATKYIDVAPNGQVLRQVSRAPPDVKANYLAPQGSVAYNNTHSNNHLPHYRSQSSNNKKWWQSVGPYTPYRTTYQDYGPITNQQYPTSNIQYMQPNTYAQGPNMNGTTGNVYDMSSYPASSSMPYSSPRSAQYIR